jgi:uncharacterized protein (TIGR01777 family)
MQSMKFVLPGGTGDIGVFLQRQLTDRGHEVVVLSRRGNDTTSAGCRQLQWDGKSIGDWASEIDGCDVVLNLAGRTVNCRYTDENRKQMMDSRIDSTRVVGEAIAASSNPPGVWLQMSTATIYDHRFDAGNDEETGWINAGKSDYPESWKYSVDIAHAWEEQQSLADTPSTRKIALRSAMVMHPTRHSIFGVLSNLVKLRLGGPIAGGAQYISWIHETDFLAAVLFLVQQENIDGAVNVSSPNPVPQREFMKSLRDAWGVTLGLPATKLMTTIGAVFMRTETELILKSRRVVPGKLLKEGFHFEFPQWSDAAKELVSRWS